MVQCRNGTSSSWKCIQCKRDNSIGLAFASAPSMNTSFNSPVAQERHCAQWPLRWCMLSNITKLKAMIILNQTFNVANHTFCHDMTLAPDTLTSSISAGQVPSRCKNLITLCTFTFYHVSMSAAILQLILWWFDATFAPHHLTTAW